MLAICPQVSGDEGFRPGPIARKAGASGDEPRLAPSGGGKNQNASIIPLIVASAIVLYNFSLQTRYSIPGTLKFGLISRF
jgi:hypothetical protein